LPLFLPVRPSFWVTGADGKSGENRGTHRKRMEMVMGNQVKMRVFWQLVERFALSAYDCCLGNLPLAPLPSLSLLDCLLISRKLIMQILPQQQVP